MANQENGGEHDDHIHLSEDKLHKVLHTLLEQTDKMFEQIKKSWDDNNFCSGQFIDIYESVIVNMSVVLLGYAKQFDPDQPKAVAFLTLIKHIAECNNIKIELPDLNSRNKKNIH